MPCDNPFLTCKWIDFKGLKKHAQHLLIQYHEILYRLKESHVSLLPLMTSYIIFLKVLHSNYDFS